MNDVTKAGSKSYLIEELNGDTTKDWPLGPSKAKKTSTCESTDSKSVLSSTNETVDVGGSVPLLIKPQLLDPIMCRQTVSAGPTHMFVADS